MSRRPLAAVAALVIAAFAFTGCATASPGSGPAPAPDGAAPLTVTDDQQRTVTLDDGPADRAVVIGSFNVDLVLALGGKDKIVGIDQQTIDQLSYAHFDDSLSVGANGKELNYEAIIAKKPDVVFIYRNHAWEAAAQQLEPLGIKVVVLSAWVFPEWANSVKLAGTVLGLEAGEQKVTAFTQEIGGLLDRAKDGTASAYYEDSDGSTTGSEGGKNFALVAAHVRNIFGKTPGNVIDPDPEAVLKEDPDVIAVETSNTFGGTTPDGFKAKQDELLARPGWKDLKAVKDGGLYLYNAWAFDIAGNQITPLFYAKWAYPDLYEDVDPMDYVKKWADEFIGASTFDPADGYVDQVAP